MKNLIHNSRCDLNISKFPLDMSEELVKEIDKIRMSIGVDRAALIKIWLHERVKEEKHSSAQ
ncbi:MAG: hypothetical protein ABIK92_05215 [Pseudomonadota bacterium]